MYSKKWNLSTSYTTIIEESNMKYPIDGINTVGFAFVKLITWRNLIELPQVGRNSRMWPFGDKRAWVHKSDSYRDAWCIRDEGILSMHFLQKRKCWREWMNVRIVTRKFEKITRKLFLQCNGQKASVRGNGEILEKISKFEGKGLLCCLQGH